MSPISLAAAVVAVVALVLSALVFLRLRKVDWSLRRRLNERISQLESRLGAMENQVASLHSNLDAVRARQVAGATSREQPGMSISRDATQPPPQPMPARTPQGPVAAIATATPRPAPDVGALDAAPTPPPSPRIFRPALSSSEVAATSQALTDEAQRARTLADLLRGVEQITGGTDVAVARLYSIEERARKDQQVARRAMEYLQLADRDADRAALMQDTVETEYRGLGPDPATAVSREVDAVVADHVSGVMTALWQRTQDDPANRDVLNQLCACCDVQLIEPRPGDSNDPDGYEVSERVDGGNADRISRTVVPGIVLHGRRLRKPLVKVFKGA